MIDVEFREARRADLPAIVAMLADDELGQRREEHRDPLPESYYRAFDDIDADANNRLIVAVDGDDVIGVLQISFIPGLTYRGGTRALIEAVRVRADRRSAGVGRALFEHAIAIARTHACVMVQLTTNKSRADARRFYESLGFSASHEGMKRFF